METEMNGILPSNNFSEGKLMGENEKMLKVKIREYLNYVVDEIYVPELGVMKKGKVRDTYTTDKNIFLFASDRVSAFDKVLDTLIPLKGYILNLFSLYGFANTTDIVPNALVRKDEFLKERKETSECPILLCPAISSDFNFERGGEKKEENRTNIVERNFERYVEQYMFDESVLIQKTMDKFNVEFIARGYLWGSMAAAYEGGEERYCGIVFKDLQNQTETKTLIKYEKLPNAVFTPTTKADIGDEDFPLTEADVEQLIGTEMLELTKSATLSLYERGSKLANQCNLILIDTKYEFGVDKNGVLHVIDEVNTPDSSRLCDKDEFDEKFKQIKKKVQSGECKNTMEVLSKYPHLKIQEFSKQYVRDVLISHGLHSNNLPTVLTEEQIIECVYRYIHVYERITKSKFVFPSISEKPKKRIYKNLTQVNAIKGCCAAILAGSPSDILHIQNIQNALKLFDIRSVVRVCSAHKQPSKLERLIEKFNTSIEPVAIIAVAGATDALSGTASFHSMFPVISCPPALSSSAESINDVNLSCIFNPSGSSNAYIIKVDNVAKFVAQIFSMLNEDILKHLDEMKKNKVKQLEDSFILD